MSRGKVLNDYIIVEKYDNVKDAKSPFAMPDVNTNLGLVKESGDENFSRGDKVYYLDKFQKVTLVKGEVVLVMKADNILKVIDDAEPKK